MKILKGSPALGIQKDCTFLSIDQLGKSEENLSLLLLAYASVFLLKLFSNLSNMHRIICSVMLRFINMTNTACFLRRFG